MHSKISRQHITFFKFSIFYLFSNCYYLIGHEWLRKWSDMNPTSSFFAMQKLLIWRIFASKKLNNSLSICVRLFTNLYRIPFHPALVITHILNRKRSDLINSFTFLFFWFVI